MAFTMQAWHWAVLAGVMLILELATPTFFFAWLAAGALATAAVAWFVPQLIWQVQVLVFALAAFIAVGAWFRFRPLPAASGHPMLNQRAASLIGTTVTLEQPVINGRGRARLGDTTWPVSGPDLPTGAVVKVVGMDGTRLLVNPVQ
jgi:membrane protein implicated in regulation of membrane protease activity